MQVVSVYKMNSIKEFKSKAIKIADWENVELDLVSDHDTTWHEFGILGHTEKVYNNAVRIKQKTGIDIIKPALWHDIGKFIVREVKVDSPGEFRFKGHEKASESYLRKEFPYHFDNDELFLIRNHGIIRGGSTVDEIKNICGHNINLLQKLILICAADISGKGFKPKQKVQRYNLSEKFLSLAREAGLDENLVEDIVLNW